MTPAAIIDALIAAGTPAKLVVEVTRIFERLEFDAARRERDRIRKQNQRSRPRMSADVPGQSQDTPLAKKEMSPHTPLKEKNSTPIPTSSDATRVAQADVRTELFNQGLELLARITGKTPNACRSLIGKMLKAVDDDAIHVLGAIEEAHRNRIADPVPWIWAVVNAHSKRNGGMNGHHHETVAEQCKRLAADMDAKMRGQTGTAGSSEGGEPNVISLPRQQGRLF